MKTKHLFPVFAALVLLLSPALIAAQPPPAVYDLRLEYLENPLGIEETAPRFFWKLSSDKNNTLQTAYEIRVSLDPGFNDPAALVYSTGIKASGQSVQVAYEGPELLSQTRYYWQVRAWDNHGRVSGWSETAYWEMGLLGPDEWLAEWIEPSWDEDVDKMQPSPMLRAEFSLKSGIASARVYVSSHGLYEMSINGQRVGDDLFTPGWTSFNKRVQYQTYDVTGLLKQDDNAVGVMLGDGWYRGFIGWGTQRNYYGERLALIAQIVVGYNDGTTEVIPTGDHWKASTGPVLHSDIYNGEYYDARLEMPGWTEAGFDDSHWKPVLVKDHGKGKLIAPQGPPVVSIQELKPVDMFVTPQGDTVIDMGQNMIGWLRLKVEGPGGTRVVLRHAEVLDRDGNFYTENLRSADQENTYILKGGGLETWEPRFTFQGFRYVAVHGFPGELTKDAITGVVIHSLMEPTGHFDCSHPLVNRLQHNIVWGQKGNFLDVPTDCPQRDERMGWTGDAQVFARTANTCMNTSAFFTKWLGDVIADQFESGSVPHVVPNVLGANAGGAAGWADAATIVPWSMYEYFGDLRILEHQYESMKAWVGYMKERAGRLGDPYIWSGDFHFGDWLSFNTTRSDYPGAYTERDMIATAYFARSTDLLARSARLLGRDADASHYEELLENIKRSFQDEFVTPRGRVISDTQTSHLLALRYDLLPEALRPLAARQLLSNVQRYGHLTTGFLGTPHLNHVLSEFGHTEQAYALLLREAYPSWLYPVTMDATTIWERWDGIRPDGSFQDKGMNSFNHYAYGAIGEWLVKEVAGIKNIDPGYRSLLIAPNPGGGLSHARAIQTTLYGRVASAWQFENGQFLLEVEVPANSSAEVILPYARPGDVRVNGRTLLQSTDIQRYHTDSGRLSVHLGSGKYRFSYPAADFPEYALPDNDQDADQDAEKSNFGSGSRVAELLASPAARAILFEEMPALMQSPWLSQVMNFSLIRAMECLPEELRAAPGKITEIDLRLKSVKQ